MKEIEQTPDSSNPAGPAPFNLKHEVMEWVKIILIAAVTAFFLNRFIIANDQVSPSPMENIIMAGDRITGSRLAYQFGEDFQRGDIAIFNHKTELSRDRTRLVKRIIGLLGETVDMKDNHVCINQSEIPLEETYPPEEIQSSTYHFEVLDGYYLMLGDNRNHSLDVRFWEDSYVPEGDILAKVLFHYYPGIGRTQQLQPTVCVLLSGSSGLLAEG